MLRLWKLLFFINILFVLSLANCSYVMDSIEASITERSSFSIEGSYDPDNEEITIDWSSAKVAATDEAFAGYEVYVIKQADNEFVGYSALSAPYDLGEGSMIYVDANGNTVEEPYSIYQDNLLRRTTTVTGTYSVSPSFSGILFFRVGVIKWKKKNKKERAGEDDDKPETTGWIDFTAPDGSTHSFQEYDVSNYDEFNDNQWFYVNKTDLDRISGALIIEVD